MAPGVRRSEPAGARMVPPREGNEARGDGRRGIGAPHTTGEAGESCPRNPVEGRGRREMDPLAGKTANTPRLEPVSTLRQRIAERARHALGMAWVIFIASWTNGYATARSEAICRGAGCGRTRTSGSVGGQGQQRPWSTRPSAADADCAGRASYSRGRRGRGALSRTAHARTLRPGAAGDDRSRRVRAVSMARSEYRRCPPRWPLRLAGQAAIASEDNHTVTSPRRTRAWL